MTDNLDSVEAAIAKYFASRLTQFRTRLEEEAAQPINLLNIDATLLLSDLCNFLELDETQHAQVLGSSGVQHVQQILDTRMTMRITARSSMQQLQPELAAMQ